MTTTEAYLYGSERLRIGTFTLTDAQIKALPTTPVTLMIAPGAGHTLIPIEYYLVMTAVASYTNINADAFLAVRFVGPGNDASGYLGNDSGIATINQFTGLFAFGTGEKHYRLPGAYYDDRGSASGWGLVGDFTGSSSSNVAVEVYVDNGGSGNLTGGNAGNVLKIVAPHYIFPLP